MDGTLKLLSFMLATAGVTFLVSRYHQERTINVEIVQEVKQTTEKTPKTTTAAAGDCKIEDGCIPIDPEAFMNATELIDYAGIPSEQYDVTTSDGYILNVQRLVRRGGKPVLMMHGLISSSECWLLNRRNVSLAYILHDAGFDVWLGNVRGNKYSRRHISLAPDDKRFWEFSFDEMAKYDVPATVDFVLEATGKKKLDYVGHSQGTVVLIAAASADPSLNAKIGEFFALAPAAYVPSMTSPLKYLSWLQVFMQNVQAEFGRDHPVFERLSALACAVQADLCESFFQIMGGYDATNTNATRLSVYAAHDPSGTSVRNMVHWAQMLDAGSDVNIKHFDFGSDRANVDRYNSTSPPHYDLGNFGVRTSVWCGVKDTFVVLEDCRKLARRIKARKVHVVEDYTHLSLIYATNTPEVIAKPIIKYLLGEK